MNSIHEPQLFTADAMFPMTSPDHAICGPAGVVVQNGRILGAGGLSELRTQFGELRAQHFPGVMLPAFVNAHVHLELTYQRGKIPPMPFPNWVVQLMSQYPPPETIETVTTAATKEGIAESLRCGVTCVGDISRRCKITREQLTASPLRGVSYGEVVGLGAMRGAIDGLLSDAALPDPANRLISGLSPHAPYTVEGPVLRRITDHAIAGKLPLAMHLAEHAEESAFLRDLSGPLGHDWDIMLKAKILDGQIPLMEGGPIRWAEHWGLLDAAKHVPVLLAHVNYCDAGEMQILAAAAKNNSLSIAYCPRTRAFFGHDRIRPHPYRELLAAGINVCLGTDSLASNPDLSVLREAAFVFQRDRTDPYLLLEMITRRGARAMGLDRERGELAAGKRADFVILPTSGKSAAEIAGEIISVAPLPTAVRTEGNAILLS